LGFWDFLLADADMRVCGSRPQIKQAAQNTEYGSVNDNDNDNNNNNNNNII
jgi:hypothetical protein